MVKPHVLLLATVSILCSIATNQSARTTNPRHNQVQEARSRPGQTDTVAPSSSDKNKIRQDVLIQYQYNDLEATHQLITAHFCEGDIQGFINQAAAGNDVHQKLKLSQFCSNIKPLQKALVAFRTFNEVVKEQNKANSGYTPMKLNLISLAANLAMNHVKDAIRNPNTAQPSNVLYKVAQIDRVVCVHLMHELAIDISNGVFYTAEDQWRQQVLYLLHGVNDVLDLVDCDELLFKAMPQARALPGRLRMLARSVTTDPGSVRIDLDLTQLIDKLDGYLKGSRSHHCRENQNNYDNCNLV